MLFVKRKMVSAVTLTLLLIGMLTLAFNVQPVKAALPRINIRADGSIDPPTAPISTTDNITYMFTDNIYNFSGISVQKSGIVVNGNGYALNVGGGTYGFSLSNVNNITIKNTSIAGFFYGIIISHSDNNVILGNNITGSRFDGVSIDSSWNNSLCGNRVERNSYGIGIFSPYNLVYENWISNNGVGIRVDASNINLTKNLFNRNNYQLSIEQESSDWRDYIDFIDSSNLIDGKPVYYLMNEKDLLITPLTYPDIGYLGLVNCTNMTIENLTLRSNGQGLLLANTNNSRVIHNKIESNRDNVKLSSSFDNTFIENNITDNRFFGALLLSSSDNRFYHNNFIFGPQSTGLYLMIGSTDTWDDGYPSGGNYWSDYTGIDANGDGIGDTSYVIDPDVMYSDQDHYPLMNPYGSARAIAATVDIDPDVLNLKGKPKWINAYVELPEGYNVSDVDVSTLRLNMTIQAELEPTTIGDYDNDTIPDLMVEFNRTAVSDLILSESIISGNVTLTLTGKRYDGTLLEGSDVIEVRMPGDINSDGKVDVKDVALVSFSFGSYPGHPRWKLIADENEDGKIDVRDVSLIARNFGKTYT
jgi:parallel beta-helix repeat protein